MAYFHQIFNEKGKNYNSYAWLKAPDCCPLCHYSIEPINLYSKYFDETRQISITYFCNHCKKPFLAEYNDITNGNDKSKANDFILSPTKYIEKVFDENIHSVSPEFCKIYNQSLQAESLKLDSIAGIGYRKSLEFLIKDFCIYHNTIEVEKIKNMSLSQVIDNYIEAPKIKSNAKVATWLGNDETHYIRKYEDKDIKDLKNFINAVVSYINYELISDEAEKMISSK